MNTYAVRSGWIGTFVIGIGYYSLAKMGRLLPFALSRGWASWALWTAGVTLRWLANITEWNWRILLPASATLQLIGFLIFFATVSGHQSRSAPGADRAASPPPAKIETWMKLVIASTIGFLLALLMNQFETIHLAMISAHPEIPHWLDQRYLFLAAWGFPVLAVWGFNARWLPVFLAFGSPLVVASWRRYALPARASQWRFSGESGWRRPYCLPPASSPPSP